MRAQTRWLLLMTLLGMRVTAQPVDPGHQAPPLVVNNAPLEPEPQVPDTWSGRCFARSSPGWYGPGPLFWVRHPVLMVGSASGGAANPQPEHAAVPVGNGGGLGGGSGDKSGVVLLVLAVAAVAALPFIVYGFDEEASPDVVGRFHCPSVDLDLSGGVEADSVGGLSAPLSYRLRVNVSHFALVAQGTYAPWSDSRFLMDHRFAAMVRFTPKQHLDLGISLGYRSLGLRGGWRPGVELSVPQEYVFLRNGAGHFGLEVRPAVFWWGPIDVSLDVSLRLPLGPFVSLHGGGRLFTVDALSRFGWGAQAGVGFQL
jgi:hypothetical protein